MNNFFNSALGAELGKTPGVQRSPTPSQPYIFADLSGDAVIAATATLSDASISGNNSLCRNLPKHDLPCREELDHVGICSPAIYHRFKTLLYLYRFITASDVLETLSDLLTGGFYAQDTRATRAGRRLLSLHSALSPDPHTLQVAAAESDDEDVAEISIDDDKT